MMREEEEEEEEEEVVVFQHTDTGWRTAAIASNGQHNSIGRIWVGENISVGEKVCFSLWMIQKI
jgi:hypothetical protein